MQYYYSNNTEKYSNLFKKMEKEIMQVSDWLVTITPGTPGLFASFSFTRAGASNLSLAWGEGLL